ncbi:molybdopterin-containing oxidoreductase family protein [Slackia piriformis]|uniref:molybdopterin-containing oxidoreductase family protein n=1 Tax=Slackia piriformis TaxID=626934 RepID=UPI0026DC78F6|nr:molybdopterin-dependent oxidoreductase [Slackia piriformis]MDO5024679.1 molybdopterin-dependent oxidoreductase [Slackia piriformis]
MSGLKSSHGGLTRRSFLKTTGVVAGAAAIGAGASSLSSLSVKDAAFAAEQSEETVVTTSCRSNCFQACMLNAHVRDGKVCYMSRADYPEDMYSGCCLRGLSMHERAYSRTRIKYPMRRVGERGQDQWERISWDEALNEIAEKLGSIRDQYGTHALAIDGGSGNYGAVHGIGGVKGLFVSASECTSLNGCYDQASGYGADRVIGGGIWGYSNEIKTILDSKHVLIWGANPVNSQMQNWRWVRLAKEKGAKLTCIDTLYSTTAARCDEFIAVRPGSDLMIALAILNDIVSKDAFDAEFVKSTTSAPFLLRKDTGLILRRSDVEGGEAAEKRDPVTLNTPGAMAKDPAYVWDEQAGQAALYTDCTTGCALEGEFEVNGIAVETVYSALKRHVAEYTMEKASEMSGVPVESIEELARIYREEGPVFLYTVYGIDHYRNGHLFMQTMAMVHALTNNISRQGSSLGGFSCLGDKMLLNFAAMMPPSKKKAYTNIPQCDFANVVASGKHKGEDYPIKALLFACSNAISNWADSQRWFKDILPNIDFILTLDTEFTDTARYSDIVLPVAFWTEVDELRVNNCANPYVLLAHKGMDPLYEAKPDSEIFALIAEKLGFGDDVPLRSSEEWIELLLDGAPLNAVGITIESLQKNAAMRGVGTEEVPFVRGADGTFPTTSGRANLYCEMPLPRVDYGQEWTSDSEKERFPYFKAPTENWHENEAAKAYPLSYLQSHERYRTHTQWFAVESMREIDPEPLLHLSPEDAQERGIENGDIAEVFNDRGSVSAKTVIDNACPKGICHIPKGWQRGQFIEGCYQDLTGAEPDPMAVNFAYFDVRVEVRKK